MLKLLSLPLLRRAQDDGGEITCRTLAAFSTVMWHRNGAIFSSPLVGEDRKPRSSQGEVLGFLGEGSSLAQLMSKIPISFIPSFAVHAAASARGLIFSFSPSPCSGHGISDGAQKAASFGSLVCGTSQRPVRLFRQSRNPLATAGITRMARVKNLAGEPVGLDQGPTLPIRVR